MAFMRSSDDASAPILSGNADGSLILVLKAVLVDGYGATDPLGWEVAFEDAINNVCVFRPLAGTLRPFIRVKDNELSENIHYASVIMYESMSDVNTGFFPCPSVSAQTALDNCIVKTLYNTAIAIPWKIIGDDRGFWIVTRPEDQTGDGSGTNNALLNYPHYIGEYTCNNITNTYNYITILSSMSDKYCFEASAGQGHCYLLRDPDTIESGAVEFHPWASLAHSLSGGWGIGAKNTSPRNGTYFYEPITILYNNSYSIGVIPGGFNMLWQTVDQTTDYKQSIAEMQPFFDGDMYVFACKNRLYAYNSVVARFSILTGDGFRNAY
jgi:hypothetical protein